VAKPVPITVRAEPEDSEPVAAAYVRMLKTNDQIDQTDKRWMTCIVLVCHVDVRRPV
jgi:hypothetical protein